MLLGLDQPPFRRQLAARTLEHLDQASNKRAAGTPRSVTALRLISLADISQKQLTLAAACCHVGICRCSRLGSRESGQVRSTQIDGGTPRWQVAALHPGCQEMARVEPAISSRVPPHVDLQIRHQDQERGSDGRFIAKSEQEA